MSNITIRNNVNVSGKQNGSTVILAHGFGCDQNMWRFMLPELEIDHQIVLFDYTGSGKSDLAEYSIERYSTLEGYAKDIIEIIDELQLDDITIVGHSVSAIIASLVYLSYTNTTQKISKIIMVCPSPCFLNIPPDYEGGFAKGDLEELIQLMDKNYIGWADYLAPLVMGGAHSPELIGELSGSFCSTDPIIAKTFAQATFFSDYRHILQDILCPTLILQSSADALAHVRVGQYMADRIPNNRLEVVKAEGHCLHMTHPLEITPTICEYIN